MKDESICSLGLALLVWLHPQVELIANALPDIAVNLFPGDEVDPNKPSLITLAAKRGPAYSTAVICLFEAGCKQLKVYLPSVLSNLVQERIEEHAVSIE